MMFVILLQSGSSQPVHEGMLGTALRDRAIRQLTKG